MGECAGGGEGESGGGELGLFLIFIGDEDFIERCGDWAWGAFLGTR